MRSLVRNALRELIYHLLRAAGALAHSVGLAGGPLRGVRSAFDENPRWTATGEAASDPPLFVIELQRGVVIGDYGLVVSSDRRLIAEIAPTLGAASDRQQALYRLSFPSPRRVTGRVAVLSSLAHQRYYHWLFDVLPRLAILQASGVRYDSLVINRGTRFQSETLRLLGINDEQMIDPAINGAILADTLVVPSLPGTFGLPTKRSLLFLREALGKHLSEGAPFRRLYVTRSDAATRRVLNESECHDTLKSYGFERVSLEGTSVLDQVRLFSEAELVVGPHGAGLSNIVFMQPDSCGLIEIMPTTYEHPGFQRICNKLSMRYGRLIAGSRGAPDHDMYVQFDVLRSLLDQTLKLGEATC